MELENEKTLESRMAQIEKWKRCKDDAEYRAKVKAENEYWEAVNNLKRYHKKIEEICVLANELYSYGINYYSSNSLKFVCLSSGGLSRKYFGLIVRDRYGVNTDHYILYDSDVGEFRYCTHNSVSAFKPYDRIRPKAEELREIYNNFPEFEKDFYEWFDKTLKI